MCSSENTGGESQDSKKSEFSFKVALIAWAPQKLIDSVNFRSALRRKTWTDQKFTRVSSFLPHNLRVSTASQQRLNSVSTASQQRLKCISTASHFLSHLRTLAYEFLQLTFHHGLQLHENSSVQRFICQSLRRSVGRGSRLQTALILIIEFHLRESESESHLEPSRLLRDADEADDADDANDADDVDNEISHHPSAVSRRPSTVSNPLSAVLRSTSFGCDAPTVNHRIASSALLRFARITRRRQRNPPSSVLHFGWCLKM